VRFFAGWKLRFETWQALKCYRPRAAVQHEELSTGER